MGHVFAGNGSLLDIYVSKEKWSFLARGAEMALYTAYYNTENNTFTNVFKRFNVCTFFFCYILTRVVV